MGIFTIIWLVIVCVCTIGGIFYFASLPKNHDDKIDMEDLVKVIVCSGICCVASLIWPIFLPIIIIVLLGNRWSNVKQDLVNDIKKKISKTLKED